jgi:hypothetical protein
MIEIEGKSRFTPDADSAARHKEELRKLRSEFRSQSEDAPQSAERQSDAERPMSFNESVGYLLGHGETFAHAAEDQADPEDRAFFKEEAERYDRNTKGAMNGDPFAVRDLIHEIDDDLEVRERLAATDEATAESAIEQEEIAKLRQSREALKNRYDELVEADNTLVADEAEQHAKDQAPEQPQETQQPEAQETDEDKRATEAMRKLGQSMMQAGGALSTPDVPKWFRETVGNPKDLSAEQNEQIGNALHALTRQYTYEDKPRLLKERGREGLEQARQEYEKAVRDLFEQHRAA